MEKRFGIKDLIVASLLVGIIVLILLAMVQFDRQYDQILTIKAQNDQLSSEVARIKRQLGDITSGGAVTVAPSSGTNQAEARTGRVDAFTHLLDAESKPGFARGGWFVDTVATIPPAARSDIWRLIRAISLESWSFCVLTVRTCSYCRSN